jgi:carbonic anhydrase
MKLDFAAFLDQEVLPKITGKALAEVVLLSCMDFRYPHRIIDVMDAKGLKGKYDHLILAGAGLGVVHKCEWQTTFIDQLKFAVDHHQASQVIVLDHRDCGAYKEFLGVTPADPVAELKSHTETCAEAMKVIVKEIPSLAGNVKALLLPIETIDDLGGA